MASARCLPTRFSRGLQPPVSLPGNCPLDGGAYDNAQAHRKTACGRSGEAQSYASVSIDSLQDFARHLVNLLVGLTRRWK